MVFDMKAVRVLSNELCSAYFTAKYNTSTIANYLVTANVPIINKISKHDTYNCTHTPYNKVKCNSLDRWWLLLFKTSFTAIAFLILIVAININIICSKK